MLRLRILGRAAAFAAVLPLLGCESELLEFNDPDIITEANSASGAIAMRNGAIQRFMQMTSGGGDAASSAATGNFAGLWMYMGLLADEFRSGDTFEQRNTGDQRAILNTNSFLAPQFRTANRVRIQAQLAIAALRQYAPTPSANIGLMFALSGYSETLIGEAYCNGAPFSEIVDGVEVLGGPASSDSAFARAAASADSALKYIDGANGTSVQNLARIIKGRALLNRGQYAAAAAAVAAVPTSYAYQVFHSVNTTNNQIWSLNTGQRRYVVADLEGGNGLPFASANDPRVTTDVPTPLAFDSQTPFVNQTIYGQFDPINAASGIEARLIQAEAALQDDDVTGWLARLNEARATMAGLAPLGDPGTEAARVDLMFRERAFWLFGTGHRLGDMRRLIRQYGRGAETVFPTGAYPKGGNYGSDVNFPVPQIEDNNPNNAGCTDRNA